MGIQESCMDLLCREHAAINIQEMKHDGRGLLLSYTFLSPQYIYHKMLKRGIKAISISNLIPKPATDIKRNNELRWEPNSQAWLLSSEYNTRNGT